jgi:hypothetical protein
VDTLRAATDIFRARSSAGISWTVTVGTGGRDHFRWFNYRANVYSTMRDTPKKAGNPWKTQGRRGL